MQKEKIFEIMNQNPVLFLATTEGDEPRVRGMMLYKADESGIVWPVNLAPFEVVICPMKVTDEKTMTLAKEICAGLESRGVDCLIDDRDQRPGVKFKDMDLIGFPLRIVLGEKGLAAGEIELKWRWEQTITMLPLADAAEKIAEMLHHERQTGQRFREHRDS